MKKSDDDIDTLQKKLDDSLEEVKNLKLEASGLKKAIWDMLNYTSMFILLLDSKLIIKLMNWSFATELGFSNEREVIGKSWLDFVPEENECMIKAVHNCLVSEKSEKTREYREIVNEVKRLDGSTLIIKWFNLPIHDKYDMTFSMGLKASTRDSHVISEDSIRSYYRDIVEKDRTMIKSLKEVLKKNF